jgi:glycosyltransferase involved in cell wall biosynthesis
MYTTSCSEPPGQPDGPAAHAAISAGAEVAYVLKGYPRLTETFIANEMLLLESIGVRLRVFSAARPGESKVQDVVGRIAAPVHYLPDVTSLSQTSLLQWLRLNLRKFKAAHRELVLMRPVAYGRVLGIAVAMCWRYRRGLLSPRKVYLKEFLQAGAIAVQILRQGRVCHLHGHFCHGATTITWFVSMLTGIPFSFTAHAKDLYLDELNPGDLLRRKLAAAAFATTCTAANHDHLMRMAEPGACVRLVYHGLDVDYFSPRPKPPHGDVPTILSVGRFVEKKGFHFLVEACARLRESGLRFRCVLVGDRGDQSERIQQLIHELELGETVFIRDAVTHDKLRDLYAQASVFTLPCQVAASGDRDGIPNTLAEAMAMAVPVVSTGISGIPELIDDGVQGLLVPPGDSAALASALQRVLSDPAFRAALGTAGRAKVCAMFDSRRTIRQLHELFADALGTSPKTVKTGAVPGPLKQSAL